MVAGLLLGAACSGPARGSSPSPPAAPAGPKTTTSREPAASTSTTTTTTTPPANGWVVGAEPLPLRSDGFGEVRPTPAPLVERALPTVDVLPPPRSGRFESSVAPVSESVARRMAGTWDPSCPVALVDLRYVTVSFVGFDGDPHTGELVVHRDVTDGIVQVFERLFDARFPIEEMRLVTAADLAAPPTGDGDNTSAFVCRPAVGQRRWSSHAYGLAIDVDPFQNPYVRGDLVIPELAASYTDRSYARPGMIHEGDVVTAAFAAIGWHWGGGWATSSDPMHFSADGR